MDINLGVLKAHHFSISEIRMSIIQNFAGGGVGSRFDGLSGRPQLIQPLAAFDLKTRLGLKPLPFDAEYKKVKEHLSTERRLINLPNLFNISDVVFMGEMHDVYAPKRQIVANMPFFKKAGVTNLGLEMLPARMQASLEGFLSNGSHREELLAYLKDVWGYLPEEYLSIIEAARMQGIHVEALNTGSKKTGTEGIDEQNSYWASIVADKLRVGIRHSKMLVYCGAGHIGYSPYVTTVNQNLSRIFFNRPFITLEFVTAEEHLLPLEVSHDMPAMIKHAAHELNIENECFAILSSESKINVRGADLYVYLPRP